MGRTRVELPASGPPIIDGSPLNTTVSAVAKLEAAPAGRIVPLKAPDTCVSMPAIPLDTRLLSAASVGVLKGVKEEGVGDVVLPAGTGVATAIVELGATEDEGSTAADILTRGGRDAREIGTNETAELELDELEGVALTSLLDAEETIVTKAVGLADVATVLLFFPAEDDPSAGASVETADRALKILWKAVPAVPLSVDELFEKDEETPFGSALEVETGEVEFEAGVVDGECAAEEEEALNEVATFTVGN